MTDADAAAAPLGRAPHAPHDRRGGTRAATPALGAFQLDVRVAAEPMDLMLAGRR